MINKIINLKIREHAFKRIKNTQERTLSDLCSLNLVFLFQDFKGKPKFSERALFHREMVDLTNFRPDIAVCIVNVMISIKKYLSKFFRISFDELLKVSTVLITNIL